MQPDLPLYERLYLDGTMSPPVLTSAAVVNALGYMAKTAEMYERSSIGSRHLDGIRHLYKYRSVDAEDNGSVEKTKSLLVNEEIWFSSASSFNDAFEMDFEIGLPESKKVFSENLKKNDYLLDQLNLSPAKRLMEKQRIRRMAPALTAEMEEGFRKQLDEALGIYCFSEDPRNRLMWGLYSDSNSGYCVQFGVYNDPIFYLARKIEYMNERVVVPVLTNDEDRPQGHLYKSSDWSYEKEWRLALLNVKGKLRMAQNSVVGVILGVKATGATINLLRNLNDERVKIGKQPFVLYQSRLDRANRGYKVFRL
jgi:hypothetical protein